MKELSVVRRDLLEIAKHVERARELVDRKNNPDAWWELDQASVHLQGLSFYAGPYEDSELERAGVKR